MGRRRDPELNETQQAMNAHSSATADAFAPQPGPNALDIDGVSHSFGANTVLDAVSLSVPRGQSAAFNAKMGEQFRTKPPPGP